MIHIPKTTNIRAGQLPTEKKLGSCSCHVGCTCGKHIYIYQHYVWDLNSEFLLDIVVGFESKSIKWSRTFFILFNSIKAGFGSAAKSWILRAYPPNTSMFWGWFNRISSIFQLNLPQTSIYIYNIIKRSFPLRARHIFRCGQAVNFTSESYPC